MWDHLGFGLYKVQHSLSFFWSKVNQHPAFYVHAVNMGLNRRCFLGICVTPINSASVSGRLLGSGCSLGLFVPSCGCFDNCTHIWGWKKQSFHYFCLFVHYQYIHKDISKCEDRHSVTCAVSQMCHQVNPSHYVFHWPDTRLQHESLPCLFTLGALVVSSDSHWLNLCHHVPLRSTLRLGK